MRPVIVDKLVKAIEKAHALATIWCDTPVNANHLADAHGLTQADGGSEFHRLSQLLGVRRSHTDLNPAC